MFISTEIYYVNVWRHLYKQEMLIDYNDLT